MSAQHGTRHRYVDGCRCDECKAANSDYERDRRQRHANGEVVSRRAVVMALPGEAEPEPRGPGQVELAVMAELEGLAAAAVQPALAAAAMALGRLLDHPRVLSPKPAAVKQLVMVLDVLRKASAQRRGGGLELVRQMTDKGGGA